MVQFRKANRKEKKEWNKFYKKQGLDLKLTGFYENEPEIQKLYEELLFGKDI